MKPKKGANADGLTPQYYTCVHADVRDIEVFDLDFSHFQPSMFSPRPLSKNIGSSYSLSMENLSIDGQSMESSPLSMGSYPLSVVQSWHRFYIFFDFTLIMELGGFHCS